ncbi:MAG: MOSC domain-containing protein [Verrucomicrobiota bacterium]
MGIKVCHLYISREHNFFGHFGKPAGKTPTQSVDQIECVAGRGIRGDRFFDYKVDYKGQITFFAQEVFNELCERLEVHSRKPDALRRNVVTEGVDLNSLIGKNFSIQGIEFEGAAECSPCFWMNEALGEGAEAFLKGNGGLRAKILTSGKLRVDE